jgi:hypothetical protein
MKQRDVIVTVGLLLGIYAAPTSYAEESAVVPPAGKAIEQRDIQKLELTSGKSKVLDLPIRWSCLRPRFI